MLVNSRFIKIFGFFVFFILSVAAYHWYRERVIYLDSAYYAFNLLNDGYPCAEHNRYSLYLYQLIPWAMYGLGFSVASILKVYSLTHILLHALVFVILVKWKKNVHALVLLIMQFIGYRECFFLSVNETALAISSVVLLSALLERNHEKKLNFYTLAGVLLCTLIALYSHPMAMILLPFVIGLSWLNQGKLKPSISLIGSIISFVAVLIIKMLTQKESGYEGNLFGQLANSPEILKNLKGTHSFDFFFGRMNADSPFGKIYFIPVVLFIAGTVLFVFSKDYLKLAYYFIGNILFWILITLVFNQGDGTIFMEKNYTPWIFTVLFPFVFLKLPKPIINSRVLIPICLAIFIYSGYGIDRASEMYSKRIYLMDRLITEKNPEGHGKILLHDSTVNHEEWLGIWALPYETILLSKVKNIQVVSAKIYHGEESIERELDRKDIFLGADFIPVLPESYLIRWEEFHIPDQRYIKIDGP